MARPVVGLIQHRDHLHAQGSIAAFVTELQELLAQRFRIEAFPGYAQLLSEREQARVWKEFFARCDVILTLAPSFPVLVHRERLGASVPIVYLPLGEFPRGAHLWRRVYRLFTPADIIANSSTADASILDQLVEHLAPRHALLPYFVDHRLFRPMRPAARAALRRRFGIGPREVVFLYVGRITSEKNVHQLTDWMATVISRHPEARLLAIGPFVDSRFQDFQTGPYELSPILQQILDCHPQAAQQIRFIPAVSRGELPLLYNLGDVCVNLTLHHDENFGFAQVEAMSMGLPVVCTDWGGLKDTVAHGQTGFRVDTIVTDWGVRVDGRQFLHSCEALLRSPALRRRMGRAARARVTRLFTQEVFADNLTALLRQGMRGRARRAPPTRLGEFGTRYHLAFSQLPARKGDERGVLAPRYTRKNYALYRELILPYATRHASAQVADDDTLSFGPLSFAIRERTVEVLDPLWPAVHRISTAQREILQHMEQVQLKTGLAFFERRELAGALASRVPPAAFERALGGLVEKGLLVASAGMRPAEP
jgi:glycosyltransferase involved in cell wall biosynthesis